MNKKIILITSAIMFVTILTVSVFFIFAFNIDIKKKFESPTAHAEKVQELSIETEEMTTNLASNNYAVVKLNILSDNKHGKAELEMRMAEIKAIIILTLANLRSEDFKGSEGLQQFTASLQEQFNAILEAGKVERVMLTEFKLR